MGTYSRFGYLDRSFGGGFKDRFRGMLLPFGWLSDLEKGRDDFRLSKPLFLFLLWIGTLDLVFATFWFL